MSKKVTGKELQKLIEGVLSERGLPVNNVNTKTSDQVKGELGLPLGKSSTAASIRKIRKIADLIDDPETLDEDDFKEVFSKTNWAPESAETSLAEDALKIYVYSQYSQEVRDKILNAFEDSSYNKHVPNLPTDKAEAKKVAKKYKFKFKVDQRVLGKKWLDANPIHTAFMFDALKQDAKGDQIFSILAAEEKWLQKKIADKSLSEDELKSLNLIFSSFDESDLTVPSMDLPLESTFNPSRTFGKIPSATLSVFNKFKSDSKTADEIIKKIINFSNLFKDSANGDDEAIKKLQLIAKKDPGMIISAGMILKYFSMVIKEISALEAGKFFEAFSAMLFSGKVVGGDAGSSDVFLYDSSSEKIFTSQKLYSSLEGVKQKIGKRDESGKGVWADTANARTIFYFCGLKDDSQKTTSVTIYICGVARITKDGKDIFYLLNKDGKRTKLIAFDDGDGNLSIGKAMSKNEASFKVGSIPIVDDLATEDQIRSIDSLLSKSYEKIASKSLELSKIIFSNAKKVEAEAVKYTQSTNVREQMRTADSLISGYDEIKLNLGDFIESFAQSEWKKMMMDKSWAKEKASKITESMIKKLIEEKFKK